MTPVTGSKASRFFFVLFGLRSLALCLTEVPWLFDDVTECSVAVPFFSTVGSDLLCRGAFGLGAVIVAALLVWVVLRALRQQNAANPSVEG